MPKFEISIEGRNLMIADSAAPPGRSGQAAAGRRRFAFYVSVFLEAEDRKTAEADAVGRVRADPSVTSIGVNPDGNPPQVAVDEVREIAAWPEEDPLPGPVFCFFPETE